MSGPFKGSQDKSEIINGGENKEKSFAIQIYILFPEMFQSFKSSKSLKSLFTLNHVRV